MKSVSVVVSAFNEQSTIVEVVDKVLKALKENVKEYEVIILNDGSVDDTGIKAEQIKKQYPRVVRVYHNDKNQGIALALERLFSLARMDYIFDVPADGQVDPSVIKHLIPMSKKFDIVVCKRCNKRYGLYRRVVSTSYYGLVKLFFGADLYDPGCVKYTRREIRQKYKLISKGVFKEAERCIRAMKDGHTIGKIDIIITERAEGTGNGGKLTLVIEAVWDLIHFWIYWQLFEKRFSDRGG